jgi:hypothetical protein
VRRQYMIRQATRTALVALVLLALGAAPAWAIPPSVGTIVLHTGKFGVSTSTGAVNAPGLVKWRPGASDTAGVGCCTYQISGGPRPFDTTTATSFPIRRIWSNSIYPYFIDGYDAAGTYVGRTFAPAEGHSTTISALDDAEAAYTSGWTTPFRTGAYRKHVHRTTVEGATATFGPVNGSSFGVVLTKSPVAGIAEVWLDGTFIRSFDCYSPTEQPRRIVAVVSPERAGFDRDHVISIKLSAASVAGESLEVDGLAFLHNSH